MLRALTVCQVSFKLFSPHLSASSDGPMPQWAIEFLLFGDLDRNFHFKFCHSGFTIAFKSWFCWFFLFVLFCFDDSWCTILQFYLHAIPLRLFYFYAKKGLSHLSSIYHSSVFFPNVLTLWFLHFTFNLVITCFCGVVKKDLSWLL